MNPTEPEAFEPRESATTDAPRTTRRAALTSRSGRFVTESHVLGAPLVRPRALLVALGVAVMVFILGRRLSE